MPAYIIAEVDVTDAAGFEEYRKLVPPTIQKYGGRYVVRGGATKTLEGGWAPKRLVVLEFPSAEQAALVRLRRISGTEGASDQDDALATGPGRRRERLIAAQPQEEARHGIPHQPHPYSRPGRKNLRRPPPKAI